MILYFVYLILYLFALYEAKPLFFEDLNTGLAKSKCLQHINLDLSKCSFSFSLSCSRASQAVQNLRRRDDNACNTRHTWVVVGDFERSLKQLLYRILRTQFFIKRNVFQNYNKSDARLYIFRILFTLFQKTKDKGQKKMKSD